MQLTFKQFRKLNQDHAVDCGISIVDKTNTEIVHVNTENLQALIERTYDAIIFHGPVWEPK